MRIAVLGAGVSGLSIAQLLNNEFEIDVLEKKEIHGGIARTKSVDGFAYHTVGGHCFNTKYDDVRDFIFNKILPLEEWNKIKRNSRIRFYDYEIDYPIEFSIRQIYQHDPELAQKLTFDFINAVDDGHYPNLEEWFRKKFGNAFAEEYFIPYNTKIWNNEPNKMSHLWVEDKLPIPNKKMFFDGLMANMDDNMPHFEFYYPKSNNQNTFIDALAHNLNILYNFDVQSIDYDSDSKKWAINNDQEYDLIINTTPLNDFTQALTQAPDYIKNSAQLLKGNGISNVLWKTKPTNKTWTYIPNNDYLFHRYIHIGSFNIPNQNYATSEVIGKHTFDEMVNAGKKDSSLLTPIDYNNSDLAYVVFDDNYKKATTDIKNYIDSIGLYTLGRFGEWQYYNMDVCIKKAIDLADKIQNKMM
ncbi:protoporphyrinogen oxidase [Dysgonomonas sp. PH5-45]|uniref:protoporphyrinogen/coproporphyrinogen oxidase n=1 Tax=unclassified Dysgonomonas TaxID=2630389 RepID=UPI002472FC00|nr:MULTISPECIES: NAD(P)-binding protein [unclassified Dysgonomonas]MDH6354811.1 protoporphyrinogen oxidase [Dysgonomonas sp. PH5-45]MDH6387710.1 protoporphyrinogen oxidase [Dysgonomonas sp. PH5-37]